MTTADFRAQARAVRAATQMKLMELRRNRRAASRYAAVSPEPQADDAADTPALPDDACDAIAVDPVAGFGAPVVDEVEPALSESVEAEPILTPPPPAAAVEQAVGMTISSATADYIARAARPRVAEAAKSAAPAPEPAAARLVHPADRRVAASDLSTLRDIGPGLVWLLERAGVGSLADLRAADPDALSDRLGLVGRLIDVRALQARAASTR